MSKIFLLLNLPSSKKQLCYTEYPNGFQNGQEKGEQTNKQTNKQTDKETDGHFFIYISGDYVVFQVSEKSRYSLFPFALNIFLLEEQK